MIRVLHYCFGAKFLDGYSLVIHLSSEKSPSLRGNLSINGQFSSICHFPLPAVKFPEGTLILSLSFSLSLSHLHRQMAAIRAAEAQLRLAPATAAAN